MNVDTMRKIDHVVGVPLTFLATVFLRTKEFFGGKRIQPPRNVLLIELSEMGSAILVDPAMQKLKKEGCTLYFVIFSKNAKSLELLKSVPTHHVFEIDESNIFTLARSSLRFLTWCRNREIDSVIDLELFSRFTALLTGFCGASNRVGFYRFHNEGLYRGEMLTHKVAYNPHMHIAKNFIALTNALFAKEQTPYSKEVIKDSEITLGKAEISEEAVIRVKEAIKSTFEAFLSKKIVLINANASDMLPERRWDRKNYSDLIKMMLNNNGEILILLTGSPNEFGWLEFIKETVDSKRCINFAGKVEFLDLPALYSLSEFMVTNDSGPAHFASVTHMHTFVIFGPETPALYGSLGSSTPIYSHMACSPCVSASNHRKTPCDDNQCIQIITAPMVYGILKKQFEWIDIQPNRGL